jgi:nucleoside-diphosphate-sugar epimerase
MSHTQTVWVIGAKSFTGKYLVPALQKSAYRVVTTHVDITHAQAVEKAMLDIQPQYVINLAAISFVPDGGSADIYAINTFGPQNILDACLKLPTVPKKIILASTSHVYGEQAREVIDESCPVNPVNHYGCSKWAMEQIAKTYHDKLNILIARPFNYTGTGQAEKFLVPKIVQHFKQKAETIQLGNIDIWRDFSDVRWVVQAYTELLAAPMQKQQVINLCSGRLTSIREIINMLQELTGHTLEIATDARFIRSADMQRQCGDNQNLYQLAPTLLKPMAFKNTLKEML